MSNLEVESFWLFKQVTLVDYKVINECFDWSKYLLVGNASTNSNRLVDTVQNGINNGVILSQINHFIY